LLEKYDGSVNPTEFLQIYSTSILIAGENEAMMANYFLVALTGTTRSWLMNLPEGSLTSWGELCRQFTANFESTYARLGNEVDIHVGQQHPGESLWSFIQQFSLVWNTIHCISNASVVVAFRQGVRDEKMLEKLTTHDVQDIFEPFSLADKCARAADGRVWHSQHAPKAGKAGKPKADAAAQSSDKKNRKKKKADGNNNNNKSLAGAPTAAATVAGGGHGPWGDKQLRQPSGTDEGGPRCPVHNSRCHSAEECRKIKKLTEQFSEQQKQ
jgi:hypothetical protein